MALQRALNAVEDDIAENKGIACAKLEDEIRGVSLSRRCVDGSGNNRTTIRSGRANREKGKGNGGAEGDDEDGDR